MSLPSSMADFVPCDHLLQKAYCLASMLDYIVMQMRKTNDEKGSE